MFWILLWFCLSAFVIGAFIWTTRILFEQKRAWLAYAKKYQLSYDRGPFFGSPSISGSMGGYRLSVFSEEQPSPDARGQRFRTVIELMRPSGLPVRGAVGSGDMVNLIKSVGEMKAEVVPDSPEWQAEWTARCEDKSLMKSYLTPERIKAIAGLFKNKNTSGIYIFDHEDALLRFDTGNPLHDPARLDKVVRMMTGVSDAFILKPGETLAIGPPPREETVAVAAPGTVEAATPQGETSPK